MLPGLFGLQARQKTLRFVTSATSISGTVNWPAGVQQGDFAVLVNVATDSAGGAPSGVTPAGWNAFGFNIGTGSPVRIRARMSTKDCDGTETGAITGMAGGESNSYVLLLFRPSFYGGFANGTSDGNTTDGNPTAVTVTPVNDTVCILVAFAYAYGTTAVFSSETPSGLPISVATSNAALLVKAGIYLWSPPANSFDMNDLGDKNGIGVALIRMRTE